MSTKIHDDVLFDKDSLTIHSFADQEFHDCEFRNLSFPNITLYNVDFVDSIFKNCDLSMATLAHTGMKQVKFIDCKLLGIDFSKCNDFLFHTSFQNCILDYASFAKKNMKKSIFTECKLIGVDFFGTDLSMAKFNDCDLSGVLFDQTNLEKVDFRTAFNYSFDPEQNKIKKAKFSAMGLSGLLAKYDIVIE